jgi:hypothetical protein
LFGVPECRVFEHTKKEQMNEITESGSRRGVDCHEELSLHGV